MWQKVKDLWQVVLPPGRFCLFAVILSAPLTFALGWVQAGIIFIVTIIMLLFALLFTIGKREFDVQFIINRTRVIVGQPADAQLIVTNIGSRPSLWTMIEIQVGQELYSYSVPPLLAGKTTTLQIILQTDRRQVVEVGPISIVKIDPLRMIRIAKEYDLKTRVFVHPATVQVPSTEVGQIKDLEGDPSKIVSPSDIPFHALREYVPGDPPKHIYWKATAKYGELMVRQFEETRRSKTAIILSTNPNDYATDQEFETAISCVASLGAKAIYDNREIQVFTTDIISTGARKLNTSFPRVLLDELTTLKFSTNASNIATGTSTVGQESDATFIVLVCGSIPTLSTLERASVRLPVNARCSVLRVQQGETPKSVQSQNLSIITISEPVDIRAFVMRKVL